MRWFTIFGVCLGILGIALSTNEYIISISVAGITTICFFDLVQKFKEIWD